MRLTRFFGAWNPAFLRARANRFRLTVYSTEPRLDRLRQHLHAELSSRDLRMSHMRVACGDTPQAVRSMSLMVECPSGKRSALNALAVGLGKHPDIRRVKYERVDSGTRVIRR